MSSNSNLSKAIWSFSAVGKDRPGIVAALSKVFYQQQCNLLDSSMTKLADQFAIVMLLETSPNTKESELRATLKTLGNEWGLLVAVGPISQELPDSSVASGKPILVSVYGADQAGIMASITQAIASHKWSVTDLSTKQITGATPVYILLLEIVPDHSSSPVDTLKQELLARGRKLDCSVTIKDVESPNL